MGPLGPLGTGWHTQAGGPHSRASLPPAPQYPGHSKDHFPVLGLLLCCAVNPRAWEGEVLEASERAAIPRLGACLSVPLRVWGYMCLYGAHVGVCG